MTLVASLLGAQHACLLDLLHYDVKSFLVGLVLLCIKMLNTGWMIWLPPGGEPPQQQLLLGKPRPPSSL